MLIVYLRLPASTCGRATASNLLLGVAFRVSGQSMLLIGTGKAVPLMTAIDIDYQHIYIVYTYINVITYVY